MLGCKSRQAKLFYGFSLEAAVPQDDFYRKLEKAVDFAWVRPMVAHHYSRIGRPSIDPEVFAKIELIAYLEGITSERALMRRVHDRLSLRRYLGYDIDEEVPDHSTLSKTRDLLGEELFGEIMAYSVRLCGAAGMVGGVHGSGDRTLVKANASLNSLEPRVVPFSPGEFIERIYAENPVGDDQVDGLAPVISVTERPGYPTRLPVAEWEPRCAALAEGEGGVESLGPEASEEGVEAEGGEGAEGQEGRRGKRPALSNATHVSRTDPEAELVSRSNQKLMLGYSAEMWTDARAGVVTYAEVFRASTPDHVTAMQAIKQQREGLGLALASVSYDKACGQGRLYRQLAEAGVVGYVPHQKYVNATCGPGLFELGDFAYRAEDGVYVCPAGKELAYSRLRVDWPTASHVWQAKPSDCQSCLLRSRCTKGRYRRLQVSIYRPYYEQMDARLRGPGARLAAIARRTGPELCFAEGKQWRGLGRAKYRGLAKIRGQVKMTAAARNIKKYVRWVYRQTAGAGKARAGGTQMDYRSSSTRAFFFAPGPFPPLLRH